MGPVLLSSTYFAMYFSKDGKAEGLKLDPNIGALFQKISDAKKTVKFHLKVAVNRQKTKVLFAVADSFFADVLLSFLTLPLGTIVRVLKEHYGDDNNAPVFGSLNTLYEGVANLDSVHFETKLCKHMLLNPRNSSDFHCQQLLLNIDDSPWKSFTNWVPFTINKTSFVISDDLRMVPQIEGPIQTLANHGIVDTDGVELRDMIFGFNEVMDILRGSVLSCTSILTKVVLKDKQSFSATKADPWDVILSDYQVGQNEAISDAEKNITLRIVIRKSSNAILFAQADKVFVDFLLCFLTIPMGEVVRLLENNTRLKSMDNLHRSLTEFINFDKFLQDKTKERLIEPKLAAGYLSENQILPLSEDNRYYSEPILREMKKVEGKYVKLPKMYMVADDLTVTPYCISNVISTINGMGIPLSDVKEVDLNIGLAEALSLLKASLTSTHALSNGLCFFVRNNHTAEACNCKTEE